MIALKIKSGHEFDIFALEEDGVCQVLDFFKLMQEKNCEELCKLVKEFDHTADIGLLTNQERFKPLKDGIYEFKTFGGARIQCFTDGRSILVLTNGFMNKSRGSSDISYAVRIKARYEHAKSNGYLTYREETSL